MRRVSPRRPLPLTILTILSTVLGGSVLANTVSMTRPIKTESESTEVQQPPLLSGNFEIPVIKPLRIETGNKKLLQLKSTSRTSTLHYKDFFYFNREKRAGNLTVADLNRSFEVVQDSMLNVESVNNKSYTSRCEKCVFLKSETLDLVNSEILRKIRSHPSQNLSSVMTNKNNSRTLLESQLKMLSQVLEHVGNTTYSPLEIENLVRSKMNDSLKSSLGSVDVMVPSLAGMGEEFLKSVENKANSSSSSSKNKSSVQRLGRTDAPMLNYIFDTYSSQNKHHHRNDRFGGPKFESPGGELSVDTNADAELDCRISSLQDKLVSWARRRPGDDNLELLTIGQQTYTADIRFSVDFRQPDNWRLVLKGARSHDSGTYECQVSTHPPLISRLQLSVNAPVVRIVEAGGRELRDKYYERNSTLKLACRIRHLRAHAVFWAHAGRILNDDTLRGGVSVKTETVEGGADSTLLVARLNASDSGRYTCSVGQDLQAVVNVHVLNESLAELHQGVGSHIQCPSPWSMLLIIMIVNVLADQFCEDINQLKKIRPIHIQSHISRPGVHVR